MSWAPWELRFHDREDDVWVTWTSGDLEEVLVNALEGVPPWVDELSIERRRTDLSEED